MSGIEPEGRRMSPTYTNYGNRILVKASIGGHFCPSTASGLGPEDRIMSPVRTCHGNQSYLLLRAPTNPSAVSRFEPETKYRSIQPHHATATFWKRANHMKKNKSEHFCPSAASGLGPEDRGMTPCPHLRDNRSNVKFVENFVFLTYTILPHFLKNVFSHTF